MFDGFAHVWTIVGPAAALRREQPLSMTIAGARVVFLRDGGGRPAALLDRCPHRGVALSLGKVRDGVIECPFHGWRFSADGANCGVPWNPDAKREQLGALPLPAREAGGLLWLYTGQRPAEEPLPPEAATRPGLVCAAQSVVWRAHWTRVMENMLDMPHLPFVHRRTIGRGLARLVAGRMDVSSEPRDYGARLTNRVDDLPRPGALDYRFPNAMELLIDPPGRTLRLLAVCLPIDATSTRLLIFSYRDFLRPRLFNPLFAWMNGRIAAEDRAVVESSLPPQVPDPAEELSVRTDAPTLAFRRIYRSQLLGSRAELSRG